MEMNNKGALKPFILMPCGKDVCQECAVKHDAALPHNLQSMYYQYKFYNEHDGKWPTQEDSMAHCTEEVKKAWMDALGKVMKERKQNKK